MNTLRAHWPLFLLPLLILLVFQRALGSHLLSWDDDALILQNDILTMPFLQAVRAMFTTLYHGDYLPLTLFSYWLDVHLWGRAPVVFHAVNLLFHMANTILVYLLVMKFRPERVAAFAVALVFAVHPLQVEPVVWASERKGLLSAFFTLGSLLAYVRFLDARSWRHFAAAMVLYLASLLAKSTAILLPAVFLLLDLVRARTRWSTALLRLVPAVAVIAIAAYVRVTSYAHALPGVSGKILDPRRLAYAPVVAMNAMGFYLEKLFWPSRLSGVYPFFHPSAGDYARAVAGAAGIAALAIMVFKRGSDNGKVFLAMAVLFLLPVLQLIPRAQYVNDRYMYLPIVGFTFVVVELVLSYARLGKHRAEVWLGVWLLFVPLALRSHDQTRIWETNLSFWEDCVKKNPNDVLGHNALGLEYHARRRYREAVEQFNAVLGMRTPTALKLQTINNMGNLLRDPESPGYNLDEAIRLYRLGVEAAGHPNLTYELRINLAEALYMKGERQECRAILAQVMEDVRRDPDSRNHWLLEYVPKVLEGMR